MEIWLSILIAGVLTAVSIIITGCQITRSTQRAIKEMSENITKATERILSEMSKATEKIAEEISRNMGRAIEAIHADIKHSQEKIEKKMEERI
jgi:gas vesicle protein